MLFYGEVEAGGDDVRLSDLKVRREFYINKCSVCHSSPSTSATIPAW